MIEQTYRRLMWQKANGKLGEGQISGARPIRWMGMDSGPTGDNTEMDFGTQSYSGGEEYDRGREWTRSSSGNGGDSRQ